LVELLEVLLDRPLGVRAAPRSRAPGHHHHEEREFLHLPHYVIDRHLPVSARPELVGAQSVSPAASCGMRADSTGPTVVWRRPALEAFGPYDLYEELGAVGLARSYRALDREAARVGWDRPIVVERLRSEFATDPDLV